MPVLETSSVTTASGTRLCFRTLGDGPPLVLAHGALTTSDDYVPVAVRLAATHQVVLVDRRGYRASEVGPGPATFAQDGADLLAVVAALGSRVALFGHSAGALGALHTARAEPDRVAALVLYEPPILFGGPDRRGLLDRYRRLRDRGESGNALVAFASATSAVPEDMVRLWLGGPALSSRLAGVVAGVGRDLEALVALPRDFEPWRGLTVPVALLTGSLSRDDPLVASVRGLAAVLPRSRTIVLPGQEHVAHVLAPDLLADAIRAALHE